MSAHVSKALLPVTDPLAEQAAEWIVRLTADDESERASARTGFDAWKQADPRHADAAARMEGFIGQVQGVRASTAGNPHPARAALNAAFGTALELDRKRGGSGRGKRIGAALAVAFVLATPAWLALRAYPPAVLMADVRTGTGQWETRTLADGTRITLKSASALNLRYDAYRRTIELVKGEILVDVGKDASRPLLVETNHGSIRALGTRFVVNHGADAAMLTMLESRVTVQTAAQRPTMSDEGTVVSAGQRVRITPQGIGSIEAVDARSVSDAWRFHQLVVDNRPLPEVLEELDRHRPGRIRYDRAQIAQIQVSAVLPLDDTDRALQLLLTNFPQLRVRMVTAYLVLVDAPPER